MTFCKRCGRRQPLAFHIQPNQCQILKGMFQVQYKLTCFVYLKFKTNKSILPKKLKNKIKSINCGYKNAVKNIDLSQMFFHVSYKSLQILYNRDKSTNNDLLFH